MSNARNASKNRSKQPSKVTSLAAAAASNLADKPIGEMTPIERQQCFKAEVEALQGKYGCLVAATIMQNNIVRNDQPGIESFATVIVVLDPAWATAEAAPQSTAAQE